jgi:lysine 2,3-aminomutase
MQHLETLDNLNIRNLSMFIPDPINYSAAFRISLKRQSEIINTLNWKSPSWINSTRLVLDTPIGKVRREDMIEYDEKRKLAVFEREGKKVLYPDLPEEMDIPGKLDILLWKNHASHH